MDRDSPQFRELVKLVGPQPDEIYRLALRVCYASCGSLKLRRQYAPEGYHAAVTAFLAEAKGSGLSKPEPRHILGSAREVAAYTNALEVLYSCAARIHDLCLASSGRSLPISGEVAIELLRHRLCLPA
jgi:hypothetical protein